MKAPKHLTTGIVAALALAGTATLVLNNKENPESTKTPAAKTAAKKTKVSSSKREPTSEEVRTTATAMPCDHTVLTHLDLSKPPSQAELIAAGNLGKKLTPTRQADPAAITDPAARKKQEADNLAFGTAIQAWNEHRYEDAVKLFEEHLQSFPNSPWAAESMLHIGCFCEYNARINESAEWFDQSIAQAGESTEMLHKAELRRAMADVLLGHLDDASKRLAKVLATNTSEEENTYASYWIKQISFLKKNEAAFRDCGQKALSRAAEILGDSTEAQNLYNLPSAGAHGFTASELMTTAVQHGLDATPVHAALTLDKLPVPFIAHYNDKHYVTVEKVTNESVRVHDSRMGNTVDMPVLSFRKEWSGFALLTKQPPADPGIHPAENLDAISGGCCGVDMLISNLGKESADLIHCGMPGYSVNPVNMNFKIIDTPMWWDAPVGPDINMTLMFNSLDAQNHYTPFGPKWSFEYGSYLMVTPAVLTTTPPTPAQVQVRDGDGRIEAFNATGIPEPTNPPSYPEYKCAGDFRKLIQTGDHTYALTHQDGTTYHYGIPSAMDGTSDVPLLLSIADRHGNTVTVTHNGNGAVTEIAHSALPGQTWSIHYDTIAGKSRITSIDDPFGRSATFAYDAEAHLNGQSDMGGLAYSYTYTDTSQGAPLFVTSITTPKGTSTVYTEPADGVENYADANSYPQADIDRGYSFKYPLPGRVMWDNYRITVKDQLNNPTEYYYNGDVGAIYIRNAVQLNRGPTEKVNPYSGSRTFLFSQLVGNRGIVTGTQILEGTNQIVFSEGSSEYDQLTRLPKYPADGNGWKHYVEYNNEGRPTLVIPHNRDEEDNRINYSYQENQIDLDTLTRKLEGVSKTVIDCDYYPNRDLWKVTDANGRTITFVWHTNGLVQSMTDSVTGDVYEFDYDNNLRPETVTLNNQVIQSTTYDTENIGNLVGTLTTDGRSSIFEYDDLNRLRREDHSDDSFTAYDWACCFVSSIRSGKMVNNSEKVLHRNILRHDQRGLLTSTTDTDGGITRYEYDIAGRLVKLTDPKNQTTEWILNPPGQIVGKKYPQGPEESFGYYTTGKLAGGTDRLGVQTSIYYDYDGQIDGTYQVGSGKYSRFKIGYDTWRRPRSYSIKGSYDSEQEHIIGHDLLGRVTSIDGPWEDDTIQFQYDDATRSVTRTSPGGATQTTTRNALGEIHTITNALGVFTHNRTEPGQPLQSITHTGVNAGFDTLFSYHDDDYDRALEVITSKKPGGDITARHTYGYDSLGQIQSWKREANLTNPVGPTNNYEWTTRSNFASQLVSVTEKSLANIPQVAWDYVYDPAGNVRSVQKTGNAGTSAELTNRSHNNLNQITGTGGGGPSTVRGTLSEPGTASVGLVGNGNGDKPARMLAGNRFETEVPLSTGTNTLNVTALDISGNRSKYEFEVEVAAQSPRSFQYDDAGNLLSDGVRTYEWDLQSRLRKINWDATRSTQFYYNALGQRSEQVELTNGYSTGTVYYLYDGLKLLARYTGGVSPTNINRHYLNEGELRKTGSVWQEFYYNRDHLGSVREVLKADGNLAARYDFDPYGKRIPQFEDTGYTGGCDLGFTGHITLASPVSGQTELDLTLFRIYDPELGRWLSPDPLGEDGGLNLYGYCAGAPLDLFDPDGQFPSMAWWGGFFDFDGETYYALKLGAAATADGFIPFGDPFKNTWQVYSDCQDGMVFSQVAGGASRDVGLMLFGSGSTRLAFNGGTKSVFYSGKGALGEALANKGTGKILADTFGGKILNRAETYLLRRFQKHLPLFVWKIASMNFAQNARGTAQAFLRSPTADSIWKTVEERILERTGVFIIPK